MCAQPCIPMPWLQRLRSSSGPHRQRGLIAPLRRLWATRRPGRGCNGVMHRLAGPFRCLLAPCCGPGFVRHPCITRSPPVARPIQQCANTKPAHKIRLPSSPRRGGQMDFRPFFPASQADFNIGVEVGTFTLLTGEDSLHHNGSAVLVRRTPSPLQ